MPRGGARPSSGRPKRRDPETAEEAVEELERYGLAPEVAGERVLLTVADVNRITARLRKRSGKK